MGVGGQRHAPSALPSGKRPGTHCTGGLMEEGWSERVRKISSPHPHRDSILGTSTAQLVTTPSTLSQPTEIKFSHILLETCKSQVA